MAPWRLMRSLLGGRIVTSALISTARSKVPVFRAGKRLASHRRMTQINSFKDLTVWQVSLDLADVCFDIIEAIPHPYRFAFANQLIPAGISIPSNIAEGSRRPTKAYLNHVSYSLGSHGEVETLFTDPAPQAGAGSLANQRICSDRADWQDAPWPRRVVGGAYQRGEGLIRESSQLVSQSPLTNHDKR